MNKPDYMGMLDAIIEENKKTGTVPRVLLHSCCAPCSSYCVEVLSEAFYVTVFYYNPNIYPDEEYEHRVREQERFLSEFPTKYPVKFIEGDFEKDRFYNEVAKGLESEPERGARCLQCFRFRLERAAAAARERGCTVLTTSLAQSRWKSLEQVNEAGEAACGASPRWWNANWRKGGLQPRRAELIREWNFYNQPYCGCEFSKVHL